MDCVVWTEAMRHISASAILLSFDLPLFIPETWRAVLSPRVPQGAVQRALVWTPWHSSLGYITDKHLTSWPRWPICTGASITCPAFPSEETDIVNLMSSQV